LSRLDTSIVDKCIEACKQVVDETVEFFREVYNYRARGWRSKWILEGVRGRVLDIGAGRGHYARDLLVNSRVESLVLVDLLYGLVEPIVEKERLILVSSDMLSLPFKDSSFDTIIMFASLHHIPYRECRLTVLSNAVRILRPGGILLVTVWSPDTPTRYSREYADGFIVESERGRRFYYFYDIVELARDIEDSGLQVLDAEYFIENPEKPRVTRNIFAVAVKP